MLKHKCTKVIQAMDALSLIIITTMERTGPVIQGIKPFLLGENVVVNTCHEASLLVVTLGIIQ